MLSSVRLLLLALAAVGLCWSITVLPIFRSTAPAREVTERIMADRRFKSDMLSDVLTRLEHEPRRLMAQAAFIRAEAFVGLGVAESSMGRTSPDEADREMSAAQDRVRLSLSANPGDSFLWLMLYSLVLAREGLGPENVAYLDQSYTTGPREGWVSLRRNRLALSAFSVLNEIQRHRAVGEFASIVDADFVGEAGLNLTGVGWPYRDQLLNGLKSVDIVSRQGLSKWLSNNGYRMQVPGVDLEDRPW